MAKLKDFYGELGVAPNSEDFVIQAAYRAMLKRYHPDVNRSADAARKTIRINEAYKVLSDPETRARYDRALKASRKARASTKSTGSTNSSGSGDKQEKSETHKTPPPVEPVYAAPVSNPPPKSTGGQFGLFLLGFGAVFFVIYAAAHTSPRTAQAAEKLKAPVMPEDSAENQNMTLDVLPASLAAQDIPEIDFGTIEGAAGKFAKILVSTGVLGARQFSEKCHASAKEAPAWTAFDQCAAFDYAAAHIDESVSGPTGTKNSYFQFQTDNMRKFYISAGAEPADLYSRLSDIEKYAGQAAEEALEAEIAKQDAVEEARRAKDEADAVEAVRRATDETNNATAAVTSSADPTYIAPNGEVRRD